MGKKVWKKAKGAWPFVKTASPFAGFLVLGVALTLVGQALLGDDSTGTPPPNGSPPEYLYLDTARTLAYLGQIDNGLASNEKRTVTVTSEAGVKVAHAGAEANVLNRRVGSVTQDVTAGSTDRFYRLLGHLEATKDDEGPWLVKLDASDDAGEVMSQLEKVCVGDFVQIKGASIYLAPYAAVYERASYAKMYTVGFGVPRRQLYTPASTSAERRAVKHYTDAVGKNPRMPFVLPVKNRTEEYEDDIRFVVPLHYAGLTSEPSSLAGVVTVVGKVIYIDAKSKCPGDDMPDTWVDHESIREFGKALQHAERPLLRLLNVGGKSSEALATKLASSATFKSPVVVVLPTAIYQ